MSRRDLVVLAADKDQQHALLGLFSRPQSLGMRSIEFDIFVHPEHDPACRRVGVKFLANFSRQYDHALLLFDHDGCGRETTDAAELQRQLNQELSESTWGNRARAIILVPELESWVWIDSPHLDRVAGWRGRKPSLRTWLNEKGLWRPNEAKPDCPKEAFHAALREAGVARSASLYRQLAETVSLRECSDRSFRELRSTFRKWFPKDQSVADAGGAGP